MLFQESNLIECHDLFMHTSNSVNCSFSGEFTYEMFASILIFSDVICVVTEIKTIKNC